MPLVVRALSGEFSGNGGYFVTGIVAVLFLLYLWMFVHCGLGFYRLRRKYTKE